LLAALGKGADIGKGSGEAFEKRLYRLHPGVLKHNFRYPDLIRIPSLPPREDSVISAVPFDQGVYNFFQHKLSSVLILYYHATKAVKMQKECQKLRNSSLLCFCLQSPQKLATIVLRRKMIRR